MISKKNFFFEYGGVSKYICMVLILGTLVFNYILTIIRPRLFSKRDELFIMIVLINIILITFIISMLLRLPFSICLDQLNKSMTILFDKTNYLEFIEKIKSVESYSAAKKKCYQKHKISYNLSDFFIIINIIEICIGISIISQFLVDQQRIKSVTVYIICFLIWTYMFFGLCFSYITVKKDKKPYYFLLFMYIIAIFLMKIITHETLYSFYEDPILNSYINKFSNTIVYIKEWVILQIILLNIISVDKIKNIFHKEIENTDEIFRLFIEFNKYYVYLSDKKTEKYRTKFYELYGKIQNHSLVNTEIFVSSLDSWVKEFHNKKFNEIEQ